MTTPERDPALTRWLAEHLERAPALTAAQADRVSALLGIVASPVGTDQPHDQHPGPGPEPATRRAAG